ncbi:MAG: mechanosensitive ion channel family protein [Xenococcaceae cyanobacterium]
MTLNLAWELPSLGQSLPGLSISDDEITSESYVPVFTRGNLDIAPIFLDGKIVAGVTSFIELESDKNGSRANSYNAATRSHLIHSKLQKILNNMSSYSQEVLLNQGISQLEAQETELRKQLVTKISEEKGTVFMSVTFPQDDVPEIIYTVTQADVARPRFGESQPLKIATDAAKIAETSLIQAWKERQAPHLQAQGQHALLVLFALIISSLSLGWAQKRLALVNLKLENILSNSETVQLQDNWISGFSKITERLATIAPSLKKLSLRQSYSFNAFYRTILFWTQWLVWMLGIGYLTSLFYWTRPASNWIIGVTVRGVRAETIVLGWPPADWFFSFGREANLGTPLSVLLFLLVTRLTIKGGDVLCDFLTRHWSEQKSIQRQALRARTLAKASKGWLRAIVYLILGVVIAYHLHQLGTITRLIAVVLGFFSFALSLASQNLLKDLLAGLLILWEDQYAVGDVIFIGEQGGLVESISLRVTKLRNLEGELITIPNGSIDMVRNLSSEWSRVNYAIEVSYDADVDHVLQVLEAIAKKMYHDPQWQEQILEPPEILGIDRISHQGILIRVIIKTQPLQQWPVGREFRLRLKKTFDEQGIEIGIPKQIEMHLTEPCTKE